jgi:hypothetical protein
MYFHESQYPALKGLSRKERKRIIREAQLKYDQWYGARSVLQTLLLTFLPYAVICTGLVLGLIGMVDTRKFARALLPLLDSYLWIYLLFTCIYGYLRIINSGFDRTVETYLEFEASTKSLGTSEVSQGTSTAAEELRPATASPGVQSKSKIDPLLWLIIYLTVIGASSTLLLRNFRLPKEDRREPPSLAFLHISAVRQYTERKSFLTPECRLEFSLRNSGERTVEDLKIQVTLHPGNGDTMMTRMVQFQYVDAGKMGNESMGLLTEDQCLSTVTVRLRRVSNCEIGGKAYGDCIKYVQSDSSQGNLLELP